MPPNKKEPSLGEALKMNIKVKKSKRTTDGKPFDLKVQPISKTDIVVNVSLGDDDMDTKETTFDVYVEVPFSNVIRPEGLELWVERLAKIQKEHSCNCTLSVKTN